MYRIRLAVVLDELLNAVRESRACFETWAQKISDDELSALFRERAEVLMQNEHEIAALLSVSGEATCTAAELQIAVVSASREASEVIKAVGGCGVFSECEAQYARTLMRYRDTLDYVLPKEVYEVVARQFAALIDRQAGLPRVAEAGAADREAEVLASIPRGGDVVMQCQ